MNQIRYELYIRRRVSRKRHYWREKRQIVLEETTSHPLKGITIISVSNKKLSQTIAKRLSFIVRQRTEKI